MLAGNRMPAPSFSGVEPAAAGPVPGLTAQTMPQQFGPIGRLPSGGFDGPVDPYSDADAPGEAQKAREAAALRLRRGQLGPFQAGANPVPFGDLGMAGNLPMPPPTNDPTSGEPQPINQADVGEIIPFGNQAPPDRDDAVGPPMSLAPPAVDGSEEVSARGRAGSRGTGMGGVVPTAPQGNFMDRLSNALAANPSTLMALGAGFAGSRNFGHGLSRALAAAAPASAMDRATAQKNTGTASTFRALVEAGVPPQEALGAVYNTEIMKAVTEKYLGGGKIYNVGDRLVEAKPGGTPRVLGDYSDPQKHLPAGFMRNKDGSLSPIKGGPADPVYKREVGERNNAPPGYRWENPNDPNGRLVPIAGGPAEKVTPETAARLGMAESFLDQLPQIRTRLNKGEATGPIDAIDAKLGRGAAGELRRQIASGSEALLRNLTGAGMNKTEAAEYVRRYELEATDTIGSITSKMNQLERELRYTMDAVRRGRSPEVSRNGLNWRDAPAGGAVGGGGTQGSSGVTSGGLNWSVLPP